MNITHLPLDIIFEDTDQPRYQFNDASIDQLAASIREVGLLNPIRVRPLPDGSYRIVFGHRRYRACKKLGFGEIPTIISENDNEFDIYLEQLTENIQREDFGPIEEAEAFRKMMTKFTQVSSKLLAARLGKSEKYISKKLDLLNFGSTVRGLVHNGKDIRMGSLSEEQLLPIKNLDVEYRDHLAMKIAKEETPVEDVKVIAKLYLDKSVEQDTKERVIGLTTKQMAEISKSMLEERKSAKKPSDKPDLSVVDKNNTPKAPEVENLIFKYSSLHTKVKEMVTKIPAHHHITFEEVVGSYEEMTLREREEFLVAVNLLIENLSEHLSDWKNIKDIVEKRSSRLKVVKK